MENTAHPAVTIANRAGMAVECYRRVTAAEGDERFIVLGRMVADTAARVAVVDVNADELRNLELVIGLRYTGAGRWTAGSRSVTGVMQFAVSDLRDAELERDRAMGGTEAAAA